MKILFTFLSIFISIQLVQAQSAAIVNQSLIFPLQDKHAHGSSVVVLPTEIFWPYGFTGAGSVRRMMYELWVPD